MVVAAGGRPLNGVSNCIQLGRLEQAARLNPQAAIARTRFMINTAHSFGPTAALQLTSGAMGEAVTQCPLATRPDAATAGDSAGNSTPRPLCADYSKLRLNLWLLPGRFGGSAGFRYRPAPSARTAAASSSKWPINRSGRSSAIGCLAVAEIDRDHRNSRGARGRNIGAGIPDHDRVPDVAAGGPDGPPQDFRIGLLDAERVLAADRGKARGSARAHRAAAATAPSSLLVQTARRQPLRGEPVERGARGPGNGRERSAMWLGVIGDEILEHPVDGFAGHGPALEFERRFRSSGARRRRSCCAPPRRPPAAALRARTRH